MISKIRKFFEYKKYNENIFKIYKILYSMS